MDICRLCLQKEPDLRPLSKIRIEQIFQMTTVQIIKPEDLQLYICLHCRSNIDNWKQFKEQCKKNNTTFEEMYDQLIESQKEPVAATPSPSFGIKNEPVAEDYSESSQSNDVPIQYESPLFQMFGDEMMPDCTAEIHVDESYSDEAAPDHDSSDARPDDDTKPKMRRIRDPTTIRYDISNDIKENLLSQVRKSTDGLYKCEFEGCTKSFVKLHLWKQHLDTHSTQKNYQCDICQRTFAHLSSLYKHKKSVKCAFKKRLSMILPTIKPKLNDHIISPKVKEEIRAKAKARASFTFPSEISIVPIKKAKINPLALSVSPKKLVKDMVQERLGGKSEASPKKMAHIPMQLPVDNRVAMPFDFGLQPVVHPTVERKDHQTAQPEKKYKCPVCFKEFAYKNGLVLHMNSHEKNPEKIYKCDVENCGKEFTRLSYYRQHLDTHSAERKYQCEFCMRKFSHSSSLSKHRKMHTAANN